MALIDTTLIEQEPDSALGAFGAWWGAVAPHDLLPAWGTYPCETALRTLYRALHNTLVQGAINGKITRIRSTPWEIRGGRNLTYAFQEVLQEAHFGQGWGQFISLLLRDFHTQNKGAFILIHGAGNPMGELKGSARKLYHLDAGRCYLTGNREYPVVYLSRRTNKAHKLYKDRVIHLVDDPDPSEDAFGFGMCALYRIAGQSSVQIGMSKYQNERLSDLPPAGILTVSGISDGQFRLAMNQYKDDGTAAGANFWRGILRLHAIDPLHPLKIESIPFATLPEQFNYREYITTHADLIALALGIDRQDILPLEGGMAGTAAQSKVLADKARGRGIADCLSMIERALNTQVLPPELEFRFKPQDTDANREEAERAEVWAKAVYAIPDMPTEMKLQVLANNVEAYADVLLNEDGELVKLPDVDVKPVETAQVTGIDTTPVGTTPDVQITDVTAEKAIQATRLDFEDRFTDVLTAAREGNITEQRFKTALRSLIARYGRMAFEDGLQDAGVDEAPSEEDLLIIADLIAAQSGYVKDFAATLYDTELSDAEAAQKPLIWWNKSLKIFYDEGRLSGNKNAMYLFTGTDGKVSCGTCKRLKGQRHRMSWWKSHRLRPGVDTDNFECGGFSCSHTLVPSPVVRKTHRDYSYLLDRGAIASALGTVSHEAQPQNGIGGKA